jgi:hypothetical protein
MSAEDDAADTIRPRLDAMGADVQRVFFVYGVQADNTDVTMPLSLRLDLDQLHEGITNYGADLVVIDPLTAFIAGVDSHRANEVRQLLSPLATIAAETGAAVLGINHLNKGNAANALYRSGGSIDFVAAARSAHGVAADPDDPERRLFFPLKSNLATMPDGIGYRVTDNGVVFDKDPVTIDAAAAFATRQVDPDARCERDGAADFLRGELADGPVPATDVLQSAKDNGLAQITVRRAASELQVVKTKDGYQGRWMWSLSADESKMLTGAKDAPANQVSTFGTFDDSEPVSRDSPSSKMLTESKDAHHPVVSTFDASAAVTADLFGRSAVVVTSTGAASVPLIVKRCQCSADEATAALTALEIAGVVGPANGKARAVLMDAGDVKDTVSRYATLC